MLDLAYVGCLLDALDLGGVRSIFGDSWHILAAETGWCALRRGGGPIFWNGPDALLVPFICAERLGDLARQLYLQEYLAGLTRDELSRVYAAGEIPSDLFPWAAGAT